jgi:anti-sigma B factor antagonist
MTGGMTIFWDPAPGVARVCGLLDPSTAGQFRQYMEGLSSGAAGRLQLDLSEVEFVDSSGLKELVHLHQNVSEGGGRVTLTAMTDQLRHLLEITGLDQVLAVHGSP